MTFSYLTILTVMTAGALLTAGALVNSARDVAALLRSGTNGARWLVARQGLRNQAIVFAVHGVLIGAVVWSESVADAHTFPMLLARNRFTVVASALLSAMSLGEYLDWRKLKRMYLP